MRSLTGPHRRSEGCMTFYLADENSYRHGSMRSKGDIPYFPMSGWRITRAWHCSVPELRRPDPVMHMKDREEFEQLISAIFYKGEKRGIPKSMGRHGDKGWKDLFGKPHRAILLSDGYYSAVPPEEIGLEASEWIRKSFILRRTHECTHYYTLRAYGFMKNALKDELIADAMGIIEAFGEYRADLFPEIRGS